MNNLTLYHKQDEFTTEIMLYKKLDQKDRKISKINRTHL